MADAGLNHQHSAAVEEAARWLADQSEPEHPIIPALRRRFDLTAKEACEAAAMASRFRVCREAFG